MTVRTPSGAGLYPYTDAHPCAVASSLPGEAFLSLPACPGARR